MPRKERGQVRRAAEQRARIPGRIEVDRSGDLGVRARHDGAHALVLVQTDTPGPWFRQAGARGRVLRQHARHPICVRLATRSQRRPPRRVGAAGRSRDVGARWPDRGAPGRRRRQRSQFTDWLRDGIGITLAVMVFASLRCAIGAAPDRARDESRVNGSLYGTCAQPDGGVAPNGPGESRQRFHG